MNTRNTMTSSFHSKIRSTENKTVKISLLFGTWTLVLFPQASAEPEFFQGGRGFVELGHFDKHFVKNTHKKGTTRVNFSIDLLLKLHFQRKT